MKVKLDLITNSSSESFVISGGKKPIDVAKKMLEIFFKSWKMSRAVKRRTDHPKKKQIMKWIKENPNFDQNIIIPWTTNFPTFIFGGNWVDQAMGRKVIVDTCNNETWKLNGLEIEHSLDPNSDHNNPDDEFLDLRDFKFKTRSQFEKEDDERFQKEMEKIKNRKKKKVKTK